MSARRGNDDGWGYHALLPVDADSTAWALRLAKQLCLGEMARIRHARRFLRRQMRPSGGIACYLPEDCPRIARFLEPWGLVCNEAMHQGTPVVASNVTSIPEIVGDAGLLCDPRSPDELATALGRVLGDPGLAGELGARGLERARRFTWDRAGEGLAKALGRAVADG